MYFYILDGDETIAVLHVSGGGPAEVTFASTDSNIRIVDQPKKSESECQNNYSSELEYWTDWKSWIEPTSPKKAAAKIINAVHENLKEYRLHRQVQPGQYIVRPWYNRWTGKMGYEAIRVKSSEPFGENFETVTDTAFSKALPMNIGDIVYIMSETMIMR